MEVSVNVHHLDSFHGHHGDLCGDCQPDASNVLYLNINCFLKGFKPKVKQSEQDEVDHLLCEAGLVLLHPFLLLGLFPLFEDGSEVELVVA